jgi:Tol biopolymer transport system component
MKPYAVLASWFGCALVAIPVGAGSTSRSTGPGELAPDLVLTYTVSVKGGTDAINSDIVVARRDGSGVTTLLGGDTDDYDPSWSPESDRIAFIRRAPCNESGTVCSSLPDDLWVANEDGSDARPVTEFRLDRGNTYAYSPSWSPDGSRIAHCRGTPNDSSLWISRVDRRASRRLPGASCRQVAWAPDGRRLAVARDTETVLVTPAGQLDRVLPLTGGVTWSPDSASVALHAASGVYTVTTSGKARSRKILGRGLRVVSWSRAEMILAGRRTVYSRSVKTGRVRKLLMLPALGYVDWRG